MADETTGGGGSIKRIRLDVQSGLVDLRAIDKTISGLTRLKTVAVEAVTALTSLQKVTGIDLSTLGKGAAGAAAQVKTATTQMAAGLTQVKDLSKEVAKDLQSLKGGQWAQTSQGITAFAGGAKTRRDIDIVKKGFQTERTTSRKRLNTETGQWEEVSFDRQVTDNFAKQEAARAKELENQRKKAAQDRAERERNEARMLNTQARERRMAEVENARATAAANAEAEKRAAQDRLQARERWYRGAERQRTLHDRQINERVEAARTRRNEAIGALPRPRSPQESTAYWNAQIAAQKKFMAEVSALNAMLGPAAQRRLGLAKVLADANARIVRAEMQLGKVPMPKGGLFEWLMGGSQGRGGLAGFNRGLTGWTPAGMLKNMITAGGWMTAVQGYFAITSTITRSIERMMALEMQTARLSQVFRGVGGDAQQLASDVLGLAASTGRSTDEAMNSAIAWSRLGLTKRQAAEATRVSLMAANVAEIDAGDATQRLAAAMSAYNLQTSEMESVLGMLNYSSNTYRVTVKELMDAISRVSGVARQAGMSLAQLQGLMAASVQRTGQTGANMANALKTVLVRTNRSDVQEFWSQRYGVDLTGSADDLRKIWNIYSKVNDEERRDIMLKEGAATQANRFRAFMDSYAESIMASSEALRNLNSAEEENAKITNTAAAASKRFIASWDRMINKPGSVVNSGIAGVLNVGSGILSGLTNSNNQKEWGALLSAINPSLGGLMMGSVGAKATPLYHNPENAHLWASLLAMGAPGLAGTPWVRRGLGFSTDPTSLKDRFQVAMQKVYDKKYAAEAAGDQSTFFYNLSRNFGEYKPDAQAGVITALRGRVPDSVITGMERGDMTELVSEARRLSLLRQELAFSAADESKQVREMLENQLRLAKTDDERKAIRANMDEVMRKENEFLKYDNNELDNEVTKLDRINNALIQQQMLVKDIANSFKNFGISDATREILSLQSAIAATSDMLDQKGLPIELQDRLRDQKTEMSARLGYLQSAGATARRAMGMNADIASEYYGAQMQNQGNGLTRGEQLLNKRGWLQSQIASIPVGQLGPNELIRAQALWMEAKQAELGIVKRILEVEFERKQVTLETNREFQRSLVGAGPSELLRKLTAARMAQRGISAGAFWSLDPGMRQEIYNFAGGDRMAQLNTEAGALRGRGMSLPGLQSFGRNVDVINQEFARQYSAAVENASNVAAQIEKAANFARSIAESFGSVIAGMMGRGNVAPQATPPPQSGRFVPGGGSFRGNGAGGSWERGAGTTW